MVKFQLNIMNIYSFLPSVEMMAGARSEETGQDYEHLELLLAKFQQFKLRVQSGEVINVAMKK